MLGGKAPVAFGGGDIKVGALAMDGPKPVVLFRLSFGGGPWRPVVCAGCGASVFTGGSLMIKGARESVFVAK